MWVITHDIAQWKAWRLCKTDDKSGCSVSNSFSLYQSEENRSTWVTYYEIIILHFSSAYCIKKYIQIFHEVSIKHFATLPCKELIRPNNYTKLSIKYPLIHYFPAYVIKFLFFVELKIHNERTMGQKILLYDHLYSAMTDELYFPGTSAIIIHLINYH